MMTISTCLHVMRRRAKWVPAAFLMLMAMTNWAMAQQPIPGNYAPGAATGMKGSIMAPPGTFLFENGTMFYDTQDFVDSDGNELPVPTSEAIANRTILAYVFDTDILGADYMPAVIIPLANQLIRPEPDSRKDFFLGDLILQPLALGWHHDTWHTIFAYNLWLPTGRFEAGASNNTGKGLYSHLFQGSVTWMEKSELPWSWTVISRYEFFDRQRSTDIRPGQVLTIDGGIGKQIHKAFDLGLTGYFTKQTTREKGSAPGTDTALYRTFALGPEINWYPTFLTKGAFVGLRSYVEFGGRNTSQGVFTVLSLAIPL